MLRLFLYSYYYSVFTAELPIKIRFNSFPPASQGGFDYALVRLEYRCNTEDRVSVMLDSLMLVGKPDPYIHPLLSDTSWL